MSFRTPLYFRPGDRVELHPGTDLWMSGARYGDVTRVTRTHVHVRVDKLNRVVRFNPNNLLEII